MIYFKLEFILAIYFRQSTLDENLFLRFKAKDKLRKDIKQELLGIIKTCTQIC